MSVTPPAPPPLASEASAERAAIANLLRARALEHHRLAAARGQGVLAAIVHRLVAEQLDAAVRDVESATPKVITCERCRVLAGLPARR